MGVTLKVGRVSEARDDTWGVFRILTVERGWLKRARTYVHHMGQFDWDFVEVEVMAGRSHLEAARRLEALLADWERTLELPPVRSDAEGLDMARIRDLMSQAWRATWVCPDEACDFVVFGMVEKLMGDRACPYHPARLLVRDLCVA